MPHVSYNQLAEWTGKQHRTIKRRLSDAGLKPVGRGIGNAFLFESRDALPLIYKANGIESETLVDGGKLDLSQERALLAQEQRIGQALKNAKDRGELIPTIKVREIMGRVITAAKIQFLALPDRAAQAMETLGTFEDRQSYLLTEVKTILKALAKGGGDPAPDLDRLPKPKKKTKSKKRKAARKRKPKKKDKTNDK